MGPLVTATARDRAADAISDGVAEGGTPVVDDRAIEVPGHEGGFFVGPTLVDHVKTGTRIYTEEIFGPVLVVLRAGTLEEVIEIVNANPYGNGTAVFTSSGEAARTFQRAIQVGMVG